MDYVAWGKGYLAELRGHLEHKLTRQLVIVGLVAGVVAGGYYTNRYFSEVRQRKAIVVFDEAMRTYYTALAAEMDFSKKDNKAAWDEVELAFQVAYQQNSSSTFAPFFLLYQAKALLAQNKYPEALKVLNQAVSGLSAGSPFYYPAQIMQASVLIDSGDQAGVAKLKALADDSRNSYQSMAQYYLAQYYLSQNQADAATLLLKQIASAEPTGDQRAPWGDLAKDYISQ
jgi:tetratricopeptide (TPR) repeat protein